VVVVASRAVAAGEGPAPTRLRLSVAVAVGGALGGLVRAGAEKLAPVHEGSWPWATFSVNIAGCLILGYAATHLLARRRPPLLALAFVGVGVCGALTTFSTLALELARLFHDGHAGLAAAYAAITLVAGIAATVLSSALARRRAR
jgi:CrcB protein